MCNARAPSHLHAAHATCVQVSWDKPPQLQTAEERQVDTSDCVWLPSEQEATMRMHPSH